MSTNQTPLTTEQLRLKRKHGTPEEFEAGCRQALGEISLDEMNAAVRKYREEWEAAGAHSRWVKITIHIDPKADVHEVAWVWVKAFELQFAVTELYFARYQDLASARFEVSANTKAQLVDIVGYTRRGLWAKDFILRGIHGLRPARTILKIDMELRGTGSKAHALAYQAVKNLPDKLKKDGWDPELADLVHWAANQRGLDYLREIRFYNCAAANLSGMLAENNDAIRSSAQQHKHVKAYLSDRRAATAKGRARNHRAVRQRVSSQNR